MESTEADINRALMLDGNAAAGILDEIFGREMTTSPLGCAHCGEEGEIGRLLAFGQAMGVVLRCPTCEQVVMRIVEAPDAIYLDMQGTAYVRMASAAE